MLQKFSDKAQKAIVIAESTAFDLGHSNVGSEHLLISLLKMKESKIHKLLKESNVTDTLLIDETVRLLGKNEESPFYMEYSNAMKSILEKAINESKERNENKVSLEVLSYALVIQKECVAIELLRKHNIDAEVLEIELLRDLGSKISTLEKDIKNHKLDSFIRVLEPPEQKVILKREKEINELIVALSRKDKPNAVLLGKAGVGKTAIVEELARILKYDKANYLAGYDVVELCLSNAVAGTKYRGEFEEKITKLLSFLEGKKVIAFIDEAHTIIGAGGAEGAIDASNMLKPYLARDGYHFILATTNEEFNQSILRDRALKRRFRAVYIKEPKIEDVFDMSRIKIQNYSKFHEVEIEDYEIKTLIKELSVKSGVFPDKLLEVVDSTMAYCKINGDKCFSVDYALAISGVHKEVLYN